MVFNAFHTVFPIVVCLLNETHSVWSSCLQPRFSTPVGSFAIFLGRESFYDL